MIEGQVHQLPVRLPPDKQTTAQTPQSNSAKFEKYVDVFKKRDRGEREREKEKYTGKNFWGDKFERRVCWGYEKSRVR